MRFVLLLVACAVLGAVLALVGPDALWGPIVAAAMLGVMVAVIVRNQ